MTELKWLTIALVVPYIYFHSYTVLWIFVFIGIAFAAWVTYLNIKEVWNS